MAPFRRPCMRPISHYHRVRLNPGRRVPLPSPTLTICPVRQKRWLCGAVVERCRRWETNANKKNIPPLFHSPAPDTPGLSPIVNRLPPTSPLRARQSAPARNAPTAGPGGFAPAASAMARVWELGMSRQEWQARASTAVDRLKRLQAEAQRHLVTLQSTS